MMNIKFLSALALVLAMGDALAGDVVVIGHDGMGELDTITVKRIYTGKLVKVNGIDLTAVNIRPCPLRDHFLKDFLDRSEEKYTAYWTIRHFVGKGAPLMELPDTAEVIRFVQSTPGAIGYIDEDDLLPGVNVIARKHTDSEK